MWKIDEFITVVVGIEGVRDGLGWSLAIDEDNAKIVLTASGDAVAFVMFGACTLP